MSLRRPPSDEPWVETHVKPFLPPGPPPRKFTAWRPKPYDPVCLALRTTFDQVFPCPTFSFPRRLPVTAPLNPPVMATSAFIALSLPTSQLRKLLDVLTLQVFGRYKTFFWPPHTARRDCGPLFQNDPGPADCSLAPPDYSWGRPPASPPIFLCFARPFFCLHSPLAFCPLFHSPMGPSPRY